MVPSMAGGDSVKFLLKVTLAKKQKEEEAEERKNQEKQCKKEQEEERREAVQARGRRRRGRKDFLALLLARCLGVAVYTGWSPYSPHCLVLQWLHVHASVL